MSKRKIWIMNHYATSMFFNKGGRHYWFAENLKKKGYEPTIFCANTRHGQGKVVAVPEGKYTRLISEGLPFVLVKTTDYRGNRMRRINNMVWFSWNLYNIARQYSKIYGKPDLILASSVHPLTLVAGIKVAQLFGVPCICEIRDLWPESFVAYDLIKKNHPLLKLLYAGERWIYKKADKLIFTMEGGKDYVVDKGWNQSSGGPVDIGKIYHINNGIDLQAFDYNKENYITVDEDLLNKEIFKVIYTGTIRKANNLKLIIDTAKYIQERRGPKIKFLIWGDGAEKKALEEKCRSERVGNVVFKGRVDKKQIPYILSKSDLNILNYSYHKIWEYGGSQNKKFEYLAAGKPILSTIKMGYDIIENSDAGVSLENQSVANVADNIIKFLEMPAERYALMGANARQAAQDYDFKLLTDKLIDIIESP